jgi:hypothetical protein
MHVPNAEGMGEVARKLTLTEQPGQGAEVRAELDRLLKERLQLVATDPQYVGAEPTRGDQWMLALVGLVAPAVLLILGWVVYAK